MNRSRNTEKHHSTKMFKLPVLTNNLTKQKKYEQNLL